jgi:hypothetical protein
VRERERVNVEVIRMKREINAINESEKNTVIN